MAPKPPQWLSALACLCVVLPQNMVPGNKQRLGKEGMEVLVKILEQKQHDNLIHEVLELLEELVTGDKERAGDEEVAQGNTLLFMKDHHRVELLLELLGEEDVWTKLLALQFLSALLYNNADLVGTALVNCE